MNSAAALGAPDGVAARRSDPRSWDDVGAVPSAAFARTGLRTTSTAIRSAQTARGKSILFPFLISANEWRYIEAGIIQRAQLLSLLLEDLYGSQDLVAHGPLSCRAALREPRIPAAAGGRACCRRTVICICWRSILRARRTASGGCSPIARKRLRAAAMHLENRTIVSDVLPDLFRTLERIAPRSTSFARSAKR